MFDRIRQTIQILQAPEERPRRDDHSFQVREQMSEYRLSKEPEWSLGEEYVEDSNVSVHFIEGIATAAIVVFVLSPFFSTFLKLVGDSYALALGAASIASYKAIEKLKEHFNLKDRLSFLNPYFGRRLSRTFAAIAGK